MLTTSSRHPVWDRKTWWSQIILNLANFVRRLFSTKAATYLLLLLMLAYVGWELTRNIVVIESFGVPKQLEEQGYSGAVVSQRIADSIARIEAEVETREHKEQLSRSPEVEGLPDFEVPGTKLSLHSLIALLRELLHQQLPRISGELTLVPANPTIENSLDSRKPPLAAEVTIRISKRGDSQVPIKIQIPLRNPDDAIRPISNAILRRLNPYVLAVHQGSIGKDPRDALAITQELINDANDDSNSLQTAKYFNLRGLILVAAQEPDKAIYNFRKAISLDPNLAEVHFNLAKVMLDRTNIDEAVGELQKALALKPEFAPAHMALCIAEYFKSKSQDNSGPIACLQKAIRLDPQYPNAHYNLGLVLQEQGKPQDAVSEFRQAYKLGLKEPALFYNWGEALNAAGLKVEALEKYQTADSLGFRESFLYESWDHVLKEQGTLYWPADRYLHWGEALIQEDKPAASVEQFRAAERLGLRTSTLFKKWGDALYAQSCWKEAIAQYARAAQLDPADPEIFNSWGIALYQQGDHRAALGKYSQTLVIAPAHAQAYYNWGLLLKDEGKLDEALEKFTKVIELDPDNSNAYAHWGSILTRHKLFEPAELMFRRAIDTDDMNENAFNSWGLLLLEEGKFDLAKDKFEQAIKLNSDYADAHRNLGVLLKRQGKLQQAASEFQRANQKPASPKSPCQK